MIEMQLGRHFVLSGRLFPDRSPGCESGLAAEVQDISRPYHSPPTMTDQARVGKTKPWPSTPRSNEIALTTKAQYGS